MNFTNLTAAEQGLLQAIIIELARGRDLILSLDDETYSSSKNGAGNIGSHFRHNLDFVNSLLSGVGTGRVDYNRRLRDQRVETDRQYALVKIDDMIDRLERLSNSLKPNAIEVASEIDESIWHQSSISRELEFVHSHTVHHHALIAQKLAAVGITLGKDFGVAPSTLKFWRANAS